ncbi:hypothetical protein PB2503_05267 [Parvularcula bermudensis HTCC2503]|uniref:DUF2794 domain-containing protein n=1 Tax=Parvularcula bermudensis (strain ATCC BAA-594 / HTCC2503 / KCTC 12087) TaxID=314260 RepID=E0TG85_PARBH|nr:DUF2794 domain-containing protein [Parvularcula bermudensis]ADM09128.1 hypothetical protein PB2503_05267 [Parvularcula bermudensis HTCC2503]
MTASPAPHRPRPSVVYFDRRELDLLLNLYGIFVAAGEWKDYAIDGLSDRAEFAVFRRTSEAPLYRVVKQPKLRGKQGLYSVVSIGGQILKRGGDLRQVLSVFDRQKLKLV